MFLKIKSYAKINLFLNILSRREDGYHNIRTILQNIALYDLIIMEFHSRPGIELECSDKSLENKDNLAYRAAELFFTGIKPKQGVRIYIEKNIPYKAGLGSASTNAAAVLIGLSKLYEGCTTLQTQRRRFAVTLGADVAFFLSGYGTALAEGIGERVTKLSKLCKLYLLLIKPSIDIDTSFAYNSIVRYKEVEIGNILSAIKKKDTDEIMRYLFNDFEKVIFKKYSVLKKLKNELLERGAAAALLSGSGSTIFGVFKDEKKVEEAKSYFSKRYEKVFSSTTINKSYEINA